MLPKGWKRCFKKEVRIFTSRLNGWEGKSMKVSVIVPVYNAEKTIDVCVKSVLNQSYSDLELILIDDGSTDKSFEKCTQYKNLDDRVVVISQSNGGPGKAKNTGIDKANGKCICFVDSDDLLPSYAVDEMVASYLKEKSELVVAGYTEIHSKKNGNRRNKIPNFENGVIRDKKRVYNELFNHGFICAPWGKLFNTKIIKDNNIAFDECYRCEDVPFNLKYFSHVNRISYVTKPCYKYTVSGELCKKIPKSYYDIWDRIIDLMQKELHIEEQECFNAIRIQTAYICLKANYQGAWSTDRSEQKKYTFWLLQKDSVKKLAETTYKSNKHKMVSLLLRMRNEKIIRCAFGIVGKIR